MPIEATAIIERLTKLRDALLRRSEQLHVAAGGKHTAQSIAVVDAWGALKDRLQEIVDLNLGIDQNAKGVALGDKNASHPVTLARIERDRVALKAKLKTVKRLENRANAALANAAETPKAAAEEAPPPEKPPAPPKPKVTPTTKKKPPPAKPAPAMPPKSTPSPKASVPMDVEDYQRRLDELKTKSERTVVAQLPDLEQQAYDLVVEWISALDTQGGRLVANDASRAALNTFTDLYTTTLTELSDYQGMVSKYLKSFKSIAQLQDEFQKSRGLDPAKAQVGSAQEVVIAEIIDRYTENGLNKGFVQPLRELLFNNVAGGLNKKEALAQAKGYIESGKDSTGKLAMYLEQTAQQGVDSYEGATNARIMQAYKIDTLIMAGSLIKTSSPQCRYCINELGGLIDRSDWPKVKAIAVGLINGTTFDNVTFNKLHWGCRHSFTPVVLSEQERSQLLQNPTNT